jgi:hypothetical protein
MLELCVVLHFVEKVFRVGCCCSVKGVDGARAVVHESQHREGHGDGAIWGLEDGPICLRVVTIKQRRTDETPNHWRVAATLACPIKRPCRAVCDEGFGDTKGNF